MSNVVSRPTTPEQAKRKRTYLDLPTVMAEKYMDAVFKKGPTSDEARSIYQEYAHDTEWGALFCEFAEALTDLKMAVSEGALP